MDRTVLLEVLATLLMLAGAATVFVAGRIDWEAADRHPIWRHFSRQYSLLEREWVAGSRKRYFRSMGLLLLAIGAVLLIGVLRAA